MSIFSQDCYDTMQFIRIALISVNNVHELDTKI